MPARRAPWATSVPSRELKDMIAARSPAPAPSPWNALAARFALRFSVAKSRALSPRMTAGLCGLDSAWVARKSKSATGVSLSPSGERVRVRGHDRCRPRLESLEQAHHQPPDLLTRLGRVFGIGHVEASLAERAGEQQRKRPQRLDLDHAAMHRLAQRSPDAHRAVPRLDQVDDVPAEERPRVVQGDPAHCGIELCVDYQLAAAG